MGLTTEELSLKEFNSNKKVTHVSYNIKATSFLLSDGRRLELTDIECPYKSAIFQALMYVNYMYGSSDLMYKSTEQNFKNYCYQCLMFVNSFDLQKDNKAKILKLYEAQRVDEGCKTQSTGLYNIITYLRRCLREASFAKLIEDRSLEYLHTLSETKVAPNDDKKSYTLTNWFSEHTWLRRDDIGIGADRYVRLSSPKSLINSFNITVDVALFEIQKSKYHLIEFFRENKILHRDITMIISKEESELNTEKYQYYKLKIECNMLNALRNAYHQAAPPSKDLKNAMQLVILSLVKKSFVKVVSDKFFNNEKIHHLSSSANGILSARKSDVFSGNFLSELIEYSKNSNDNVCPTTGIEHDLFKFMMASLRVQTSDIPKLRYSDFKFLRRANGYISHIECEYFKGRAQDYHTTETIGPNTDRREALINFISDRSARMSKPDEILTFKGIRHALTANGAISELIQVLSSLNFNEIIQKKHDIKGVTSLFVPSLAKLMQNGPSFHNSDAPESKAEQKVRVQAFRELKIFGLSGIKNTAVHAVSDLFDPTQLLNFNSHTMETERKSYLTPDNEEWENNCGLITRAVMQDIHKNLYRISEKDTKKFQSEYTKATFAIENRKQETLARLKIITEQNDGAVNELGISSKNTLLEDDLPDTIYLVDSPETVMKLKHYLDQAERHYKAILKKNPEFLFNTLLPTLEWIEEIFLKKKFSKKSLSKGSEMFNTYKKILPPIFQAQGY